MKTIVLPILLLLIVADTCLARKKQFIADTTLAGKWFTEATFLQEDNNYEGARAVFSKAADLYKKHKQWNKLSQGYVLKGEYDQALQHSRQTLTETKDRLAEHHIKAADMYHVLGVIYFYEGESDKTLEYYQLALNIRLTTFGLTHPQVPESYNNTGCNLCGFYI